MFGSWFIHAILIEAASILRAHRFLDIENCHLPGRLEITMLTDSKVSVKSIKQCSLNCANNGYCTFDPITSSSHNLLDGKLRELCICPKGYTGLTCQNRIGLMDKCLNYGDKFVCLNGGHCRQVLTAENLSKVVLDQGSGNYPGEWMCDCVEADGVSPFAGDMCRKPHTEYCNNEGTAYCTNGGSCMNGLLSNSLSGQYEG